MAGYDGYSKSNNAVAAESEGRYPASTLARKLGVKTGAIRALMDPCEWHHTSKRYNTTDYYDGADLLLLARGGTIEATEEDWYDDPNELLTALRNWKPPKTAAKTWTGCTVTWLEWGGTRKRPAATEETADGCTIEWKGGKFCTVTFSSGATMRKGIDTRGFEARDNEGNRIYFSWSN